MKDEDKTKVEPIKGLKTLRKKREKSAVNNITERKQAEEKLSETKEYLENLIKYANAPIIVWDSSLLITRFNRAFENLSGYHANEVIGKKIDILFSKDKIGSALEHIQKTSSGERWKTVEIEIQRKDGEPRIVLWNSANILDTEKKNVIATIAQGQDITERKQAEEKLKDSEEYLRLLFDYTPDAYYISDLKGNFVDCNKGAERLTGYKKEELIGKNFQKLKLFSTNDIPKVGQLFDKNLGGLSTGEKEFVLNKKDNNQVTVEISSYTVKIKGRTLALGIIRDITARKEAEEALVESEEKYRAVFENTGTAMLVIEEDMTGSMVNTQCEKLSGYSKKEIENKMKWTDFVVPEDLEEMKKYHIARRQAGEKPPTEYEFRLMDKKGKVKDIFMKIGMIPNTKKSVASLTDITERKKAEIAIVYEQSLLHALMDNIPDFIYFKDEKNRFVRVNKTSAEDRGVTPEDFIGKTDFDIFTEEAAKKCFADDDRVMKTGKPLINSIEKITYLNGMERWFSATKVPRYDEKGKIIGTIGITRDITERKQAEERIKHLNLVLRAIRNINQLIFEEKDRERLLKGVCNSLAETRGYNHTQIVLLDEEGKIDTYTEAGLGKDFLPLVKLLKKGETIPCGRLALKQRDVVIIKDPASTCPDCPLVQVCSARGSAMTVRLENKGKIYGIMSVSIPAYFITDKEEQALFKEVTGDIALGLYSIEMGKKLDKQTHDLQQSYQRIKRAMDATVETMSKILEAKDPYTAGHQQQVSQLTTAIAKELNLSQDKIEGIRIASLIHDIGKIGLPTEILSKPSKLTDIEFSLIKEHSQIGYDILKSIDFSYPVANIVLQHHERLNGSGYPNHLKGDQIFLEARIIGVADVVEAMSSHRPYRPALGIDKALEEISKNKGILYDPEVVDACLKLFKEKGFKFE